MVLIVECTQVNCALQRSLAPSVFDSAKFSVDVLDGVVCILRLGHGPLRAINEFHTLFKQAAACTGQTEDGGRAARQGGRIPKTVRKQFTMAVRKLWFFVIWCAETGGEDGSCLNWLQLAASVAAQAQALQAAATTGEELRAHISIIRPKMADMQTKAKADAKASPVRDTTVVGADLPVGEFKTKSDTAAPAEQHQRASSSKVDERFPQRVTSLAAQHEKQAKLCAELRSSEDTDDNMGSRLHGSKSVDDGDSDLPDQRVAPSITMGAPSTTPLLSPNQLVAKLWPAHGDSKPTQDEAENHPKLQTTTATEACDASSAAAPNPWRTKRENRAKKSKAAAAKVFRSGQGRELQ